MQQVLLAKKAERSSLQRESMNTSTFRRSIQWFIMLPPFDRVVRWMDITQSHPSGCILTMQRMLNIRVIISFVYNSFIFLLSCYHFYLLTYIITFLLKSQVVLHVSTSYKSCDVSATVLYIYSCAYYFVVIISY